MDGQTNIYDMVGNMTMQCNADDLEKELNWLEQLIDARLQYYFQEKNEPLELLAPDFSESSSPFALFIQEYKLNTIERIALILGLTPHIKPQLLDVFFTKNKLYNKTFTEFGGANDNRQKIFLPTGQTFLFIVAENDLKKRFEVFCLFNETHFFHQKGILSLSLSNEEAMPLLTGILTVSQEYLDLFTLGYAQKPKFSLQFPAKQINTQLSWDDLVLEKVTLQQVEEMITWNKHQETIMHDWNLGNKLRPGYRSLFYGPPGTGKTMTASLLGKTIQKPVYKIDLSIVISKYIGETEKNLSTIFKHAENKDWILFFDEADALFGKRTDVKDAHDRYANQEVSYLLQRVEEYNGIVILASNKKKNIDEAFARRFETMIHFPIPKAPLRLKLWEQGFSKESQLDSDINIHQIAERFEVSGATIMNVIRYCSLQAAAREENTLLLEDLIYSLQKEFQKEGKTLPKK